MASPGRPKAVVPSVRVEIQVPADLDADIRLAVLSPINARLRSGALSEFFVAAARQALNRIRNNQPTAEGRFASQPETNDGKY